MTTTFPPSGRDAGRRRVLAFTATIFLFGVVPAAAWGDTSVEGETLSVSRGSAGRIVHNSRASSGAVLRIVKNAKASKSVITPEASTRLILRARGVRCGGAPQLTVSVDGVKRLSARLVSTRYATFSAPLALRQGQHAVAVRYADERRKRRCNRSVSVDWIKLASGLVAPTPVPAPGPVPAPPPAPAPGLAASPTSPPPAGRLVKAASFENDTSEVNLQQAAPGRISSSNALAIEGHGSLHFQVQNGDRWSQDVNKSRSEALIEADRGYAPKEGEDYWHRWWFRIPASTPLPTDGATSIHLTQSWASDLSGLFAGLTFRSDALTFDNRGGRVWSMPRSEFKSDRWYKMLWHSHYSTSASKGYDELWVDDAKVGMMYAQTLAPTSSSYFKFGLYRLDYGQGTADMYFDGLRVATTREMAEAG